MAKIVKSVRIDEKMLEVIELYKKEMKRMFGINVSTSAVLSQSIVLGFEENLKIIKLLMNGHITFTNENEKPVITKDTEKLIQDYNYLYYSNLSEE